LDEYRKYIEKDPALERRFQQVGAFNAAPMKQHTPLIQSMTLN
jgi:ATP-dependent Clp protease ATP-binding subunit ClpA